MEISDRKWSRLSWRVSAARKQRAGAAVTVVAKKARRERLVMVSIFDAILISLFDLDVLSQIVRGDVRRVNAASVVRRNA